MKPNILLIDIETAPNIAMIWSLRKKEYLSPNTIVQTGRVLCVSMKWVGSQEILFYAETTGKIRMLKAVHKALDKADVVVHYNGNNFDIPILNREFIEEDIPPPSPSKHVDLLPAVRRVFKFQSNKLDYVCQRLGLGAKVQHKGLQLWKDCMDGNKEAWTLMERYNKKDVLLLQHLYKKLLPWIPNPVNYTLYDGDCPRCGEGPLRPRGYYVTRTMRYKRYKCSSCLGWSKDRVSMKGGGTDRVPL